MINTRPDLSLNLFRRLSSILAYDISTKICFTVWKKQLSLKIFVPFFSRSTEECGSWRNRNSSGVVKFLKYSNIFNLFSEALIPSTLFDKKLNLLLDIHYLVNRSIIVLSNYLVTFKKSVTELCTKLQRNLITFVKNISIHKTLTIIILIKSAFPLDRRKKI